MQNEIVNSVTDAVLEAEVLRPRTGEQTLEDLLDECTPGAPVWVFGYGSLIWHPEFSFDRKRCGVVYGFHRSLCLWSRQYRGTPERPGLVLGLEPGGCCRGVAFRIPPEAVRAGLSALWKREMTGSYIARWLDVRLAAHEEPHRIRALGFVMDRRTTGYTGELDRSTLMSVLETARGERGTSAEYLLSTVRCLQDHGIQDRHLAGLAEELLQRTVETPADQTIRSES